MRVVEVGQSHMLAHEVLVRSTIRDESLLHDLKVGGKCFVKEILQKILLLIVTLTLVPCHLHVPVLFLQVRIGIQC